MTPILVQLLAFAHADPVECTPGTCNRADSVIVVPDISSFNIPGATFELTDGVQCDPNIKAKKDNLVPGIKFLGPNPHREFGAVVLDPFEIEEVFIEVEDDVDTSGSSAESFSFFVLGSIVPPTIAQVCTESDKSAICVITRGDTPTYLGPADDASPQGMWTHTMDDVAANYEFRQVREDEDNDAALDGCWNAAAAAHIALPNCLGPILGLGPVIWEPTLDNMNTTSTKDYTGYFTECVEDYRAAGVVPCGASVVQPMEMKCIAGTNEDWYNYDAYTVDVAITATQVAVRKRNGSWQTPFVWP